MKTLTAVTLLAIVPFLLFGARATEVPRLPSPPLLPNDLTGAPLPKSVKIWMRLSVWAIPKHYFPIVWLSPQTFPRHYFERLIVLKPGEYKDVMALAHTYSSCLDPKAMGDYPVLWVAEYSPATGERGCRFSSTDACEFLNRLAKRPEIAGVARKTDAIGWMAMSVDCKPS